MSDSLVSRLRGFATSDALGNGDFSVCYEAADALEAAERDLSYMRQQRDSAERELDRAVQERGPDYRTVAPTPIEQAFIHVLVPQDFDCLPDDVRVLLHYMDDDGLIKHWKPQERGEPVAWRCKDYADGWILFHSYHGARYYQDETGCLMQPLYAAPAPAAPVDEQK